MGSLMFEDEETLQGDVPKYNDYFVGTEVDRKLEMLIQLFRSLHTSE